VQHRTQESFITMAAQADAKSEFVSTKLAFGLKKSKVPLALKVSRAKKVISSGIYIFPIVKEVNMN
jgi:hypothetical protein